MTRFFINCFLIGVCTFISCKLLGFVDYELMKKYFKLILFFWVLFFLIFNTKSETQKEIEQDKWDFIRITEGRKNWERYFNSEIKDRIRGHKRVVLSKEDLQNK